MVTWHPSVKSHDGGMVHQTMDADKEWSGGDDLLNTLCEISKANDEDLLEALMSMHDKETVVELKDFTTSVRDTGCGAIRIRRHGQ
jgi:hypothetical protein